MDETIESVLLETRLFPVPATFTGTITPAARAALDDAAKDQPLFWGKLAREELAWDTPFETVLDARRAPHFAWFPEGRLNASVQCLDIHKSSPTWNKPAIIWEAEDGATRTLTYAELHRDVARFAAQLLALGITCGDRVIIYMPMVPEVAVAMLACARIGAIHSVVFGGFSAAALADRIQDTGAKMILTSDGAWRAGKVVPLKENVDVALESANNVETVIVLRRTESAVNMVAKRDLWWHELADVRGANPVAVPSEHPLFILYTSGSTGKPKGIVHSTAGYMLWAKKTSQWVFDLRPGDVYWCTADVGWITGHSYVVYGPLAAGATVLMYEGAPTFPEPDRFWDVIERHGVTVFYTAPTAIRALMRAGDQWPAKHDLSSLRLLGSVGEPINPEAWMWYHETIGDARCPIVDTWWQTETGGIILTPLPGVDATKPGSCVRPLPGIDVAIVDEAGNPVDAPNRGGYLVIRSPWPSMARTVWGDDKRFQETYWDRFGGRYYVAGDTAVQDEDGYFRILGRFDDVLNVSGHRLGTMELESALVSHPDVIEAAVVGRPDAVKGEAVCAFVVLQKGAAPDMNALRNHVAKEIGPIAKPDDVRFAEALPKTRSGKIMRRILRDIAQGKPIEQDISTLENADAVAALAAEGPANRDANF